MARRGYDEVTLVTGFPNFRARKMVEYIASVESRTLLYLVVRQQMEKEANAALARLPQALRERIVIIEGDAAAMDLGLSGAEYRTLGAEVDRVHHLAQVTFEGVRREITEATNIGAMREVIELGRCCKNMRSSATIALRLRISRRRTVRARHSGWINVLRPSLHKLRKLT